MTDARRSAASPSTGRSRSSPAPTRPRSLAARAQPRRASAPALPVGFAHDHRAVGHHRRHHPDHRARAWCSGCPHGYRAAVPRRAPHPGRSATPACCWPSRPRPTCTPRPATPSPIGRAGAAARARSPSPASSTCPQADSLFQKRRRPARRAAAGAAGQRACCCPQALARLFDPLAARAPGPGRTQIHARARPRTCPADPAAAYTAVTGARPQPRGRSSPAAALVGDNLGAALDAARSDAALRPDAVPVPRAARRGAGRRC